MFGKEYEHNICYSFNEAVLRHRIKELIFLLTFFIYLKCGLFYHVLSLYPVASLNILSLLIEKF